VWAPVKPLLMHAIMHAICTGRCCASLASCASGVGSNHVRDLIAAMSMCKALTFCVLQAGNTALHLAAAGGHAAVVRELLRAGAGGFTRNHVRVRAVARCCGAQWLLLLSAAVILVFGRRGC
jgi:hypothetical protein